MTPAQAVLRDLVASFGGDAHDLAEAAGVPTHSLRRINAKLDIEMALRLAHVTGMSASVVLKATNHGAFAELLEAMYGPPAMRRGAFAMMAPIEARTLMLLRALPTPERRLIATLVTKLAPHNGHPPPRAKRGRPKARTK